MNVFSLFDLKILFTFNFGGVGGVMKSKRGIIEFRFYNRQYKKTG